MRAPRRAVELRRLATTRLTVAATEHLADAVNQPIGDAFRIDLEPTFGNGLPDFGNSCHVNHTIGALKLSGGSRELNLGPLRRSCCRSWCIAPRPRR